MAPEQDQIPSRKVGLIGPAYSHSTFRVLPMPGALIEQSDWVLPMGHEAGEVGIPQGPHREFLRGLG